MSHILSSNPGSKELSYDWSILAPFCMSVSVLRQEGPRWPKLFLLAASVPSNKCTSILKAVQNEAVISPRQLCISKSMARFQYFYSDYILYKKHLKM